MAQTTDYTARRAEAGARYAAACTELREAMVDLAATDSLQQPSGPVVTGDEGRPYTFAAANLPDALPDLRHREFQPNPPKGLRDARAARKAELLAPASV